MGCATVAEIVQDLRTIGVTLSGDRADFPANPRPSDEMIDRWAETAALAEPEARSVAIWTIHQAALAAGIVPSSIEELYRARAADAWSDRTVPAMNLRGWSYNTCRSVFRAARTMDAGLFIFEQAISEQVFAAQPPIEYTAAVLAAALREGYQGPVFLQADHDQINAKAYAADPAAEVARLEAIIRTQIAAGFYNIDIDASTVVGLDLPTVAEQQRENAALTAHFTQFVRGLEPASITIALGAEIGEVGHENTTPEELHAFMGGYAERLTTKGDGLTGVAKISINTGTYHGGKMQADGVLAPVTVDYDSLTTISALCRREYAMGGAVQHGASTLPGEQLARFPEAGAVEIHLALGFNNLIFDHPSLPQAIRDEIRDYTFTHHAQERAPGETDAQFLYNTRKKAWKVVKERFWRMAPDVQDDIMGSLEGMFRDMFTWMNVGGTHRLVRDHTTMKKTPLDPPAAVAKALAA